jgi:cytochrome c553
MTRLAIAVALAALGLNAQAADPAAGKKKAEAVCAACHGIDGNKPSAPDQPVLAGQYKDYLIHALSDYKNGRRQNPIMKGFADPLSKKDIEDLAEWFSTQKTTRLHDQR